MRLSSVALATIFSTSAASVSAFEAAGGGLRKNHNQAAAAATTGNTGVKASNRSRRGGSGKLSAALVRARQNLVAKAATAAAASAPGSGNVLQLQSPGTACDPLTNHPDLEKEQDKRESQNEYDDKNHKDLQGILSCGVGMYCLDLGKEQGGVCVTHTGADVDRQLQTYVDSSLTIFDKITKLCYQTDATGGIQDEEGDATIYGGDGDDLFEYYGEDMGDMVGEGGDYSDMMCECTNLSENSGYAECSLVDDEPECYTSPSLCFSGMGPDGELVQSNDAGIEMCMKANMEAAFPSAWEGSYRVCYDVTSPVQFTYCLDLVFDGTPDVPSDCTVTINGEDCNSCEFGGTSVSDTSDASPCQKVDCRNLESFDAVLSSEFVFCGQGGFNETIVSKLLASQIMYESIGSCPGGCNVCYGGDLDTFYMLNPDAMVTYGESDDPIRCEELQMTALTGILNDVQNEACSFMTEVAASVCGCTCGVPGIPCSAGSGDADDVDGSNPILSPECEMAGDTISCPVGSSFAVDGQTSTLDGQLSCSMNDVNQLGGFVSASQHADTCQCATTLVNETDGSISNLDCNCYVCDEGSSFETALTCTSPIAGTCTSFDCDGICNGEFEPIAFPGAIGGNGNNNETDTCAPFDTDAPPIQDTMIVLDGPLADQSFENEDTMLVQNGSGGDGEFPTSVALLSFPLPLESTMNSSSCDIESATLRLYIVESEVADRPPREYVAYHFFDMNNNSTGTESTLEAILTGTHHGSEFIIGPGDTFVDIDVSGFFTDPGRKLQIELIDQESLDVLIAAADGMEQAQGGDRFYTLESDQKPSFAITYATSDDQPPMVDPILPDVEECTTSGNGGASCPVFSEFTVGDQDILLDATLFCPSEELQIHGGDFVTASRHEDACTCTAVLTTRPASAEDDEGEDIDVVADNEGEGNPSRAMQDEDPEVAMDCECYICPEGSTRQYAYTCSTPIAANCSSFNCNGACNEVFVPLLSNETLANITNATSSNSTSPQNATNNVTAPIIPNDCDNITIGNIYFIFVSSVDPDEVSLFGFEDLPGNLDLYVTDNAWNGDSFETNEGILKLTTPPDRGIPAGVPFGVGPNGDANGGAYEFGTNWTSVQGVFSLSTDGEQVFLFCIGADKSARPLAAISYNGPFSPPGLASYGTNESALPDSLAENGTIVLPHEYRWEYQSRGVTMDIDDLRADIRDTNNWRGSSPGSGAATVFHSWSAAALGLLVLPILTMIV